MPVLEQLVFFASLYGIDRRPAERVAREWLHRFRISDYADRTAESLSKGNQQKVQFIATVLHDPDVLVMDEPFTGLDPVNAAMLRAAFLEMRDQRKTLIFSTGLRGRCAALRPAARPPTRHGVGSRGRVRSRHSI
jgi:ABC-2 type transport system ATP-binding protein